MVSVFKTVVALTVLVVLAGCEPAELGKQITERYDLPKPTEWMVPDGKAVDIGGEVVSIIGSDSCNTGFGDSYSCWKFSLIPGQAQKVTLSNGIKEKWTTQAAGENRIVLVRPNGFKVTSE